MMQGGTDDLTFVMPQPMIGGGGAEVGGLFGKVADWAAGGPQKRRRTKQALKEAEAARAEAAQLEAEAARITSVAQLRELHTPAATRPPLFDQLTDRLLHGESRTGIPVAPWVTITAAGVAGWMLAPAGLPSWVVAAGAAVAAALAEGVIPEA